MSDKETPEARAEREAALAAERAKATATADGLKPDVSAQSPEDAKAADKTAQKSGFQVGKQVYFDTSEGKFIGEITRISDSTVHVRQLDGDEKEFSKDAVELV